MKKLILLSIISLTSLTAYGQIGAANIGWNDDPGAFTAGLLYNNIDVDLLIGTGSSIDDDSEFTIGGKLGYMLHLIDTDSFVFYAGPQVGYYSTENYSQETSVNGLLYGGGAGIYLGIFNFAAGYGVNDVTETNYLSFKVGFDLAGGL